MRDQSTANRSTAADWFKKREKEKEILDSINFLMDAADHSFKWEKKNPFHNGDVMHLRGSVEIQTKYWQLSLPEKFMAPLASLLNGMFEFIVPALDAFPGLFKQK